MKKTIEFLFTKKKLKQKITMLTCYDFQMAQCEEAADIDCVLVGDSVGTNVLGYPDETHVTMADMVHHVKAVKRGINHAFLIADLPYRTHETPEMALKNAMQFMDLGVNAVKFEGEKPDIMQYLTAHHIPVVGHIGLNPQYHQNDMKLGKIVRGKHFTEATRLIESAIALEKAGAILLILEKIPDRVSELITNSLSIPTIGIGAGIHCDGQVLIVNDVLGVGLRQFKHVTPYLSAHALILQALGRYRDAVSAETFPLDCHANHIQEAEFESIVQWMTAQGLRTTVTSH